MALKAHHMKKRKKKKRKNPYVLKAIISLAILSQLGQTGIRSTLGGGSDKIREERGRSE